MSSSDVLSAAATTQVVFIDSRTPDIQALIAGAAPGERVFVLDATSDGVQQIADILAANNLTGLSAISIVGHGTAGAIDLGSTVLNESNLAEHSAALATIGAALTADGDIALYACNTAAGAAGQQFIADLSTYTSADVAAATHVVGDAAHGGSWTLDASTGTIEASAPFTDATLASFQGALAGALDGQLWFGTSGAGLTAPFGFINSDGSNQTTYQASSGTSNAFISNIGLDTVNGLYFALSQDVNDDVRIISGSMTTGTKVSSLSLNPDGLNSLYTVNALAVDAKNHVIYLGIWGTNADSGIIKVSYDPQTGVVNGGSSILTGGVIDPTKYVLHAGTSFTNPLQFSLDTANQKLYFVANDLYGTAGAPYPGYTASNGIYVVDLTSGSPTATLLSVQSQFPTTDPTHGIVGMAVNYAQGIIYFVTSDLDGTISTAPTFWEMPIGGGTATQMPVSGLTNVPVSGLTFDPVSRQLIVSNTQATGSAVYTLALDAAGTHVGSPVLLVDINTSANSDTATGLAFNALPTIGSLSGNASQALEGGSGVALLGTTPNGVVDADSGGYLASATVTITNAQAGDIIGVDATFSFTTTPTAVNPATGGSFLVSYDSATHKLTIANASGVTNTIAQYEALLAHITFRDTGTDTTTVGHPTRTVSWQLNDGSIGNPVGTNNVTTTTITIDRAPVATADTGAVVAGASVTPGNVLGNDIDRDGDTRTVTSFSGFNGAGTLGSSYNGHYGHLTLSSTGAYTYIADNTALINSATAGSHPTDTFTYTVSDGNGGTSSSTLTITIDRAPTVVADTDTVVAGASTVAGHTVFGNDSDPDNDSFTVTAVAGSGGNVGVSIAGTYGHLTLNSNGTYSYAADNAGAISTGATGSHLTDTFTYTAGDAGGGASTTTLTITLDRAPTVVADTNTALSGGAAVNGNVLTNDGDADNDGLTVSAVSGGAIGAVIQGQYGNYTLNTNGTYTYTAGVTPTQLSNLAAAGPNPVEHITYTASDGQGGTTSSSLDISVETAPVIASITAAGTDIDGGGNGDLNAGHVVTLSLHMSSVVTVAGGTPTLILNDGGTATYTGGSGSDTLTFTYTVLAGHNTADLAVSSLALNSATIQDAASQNADFTTVPAVTGTLQIDTIAATVSSVTTSGTGIDGGGNGDLNAGHVVTFTVHTSEAVVVDTTGGTPTLTLSNGATATYTGGSGSTGLTFSYTVAAGQDTSDLAVTAVNLNGGTVKDGAANIADLSAAVTDPAGTLQIDTVAPTVSSVTTSGTGIDGSGNGDLNAGHTVTFTVSLSEAVTVAGGTPTLTLNDGGIATYSGGSGTNTLTFSYTVAAGENTSDLAVTGSSLNGATVLDGAGNAANLAGAATNPAGTLQIDTTAPTVSSVATSGAGITAGDGLLHTGDTVTFTVTLSEVVTVAGGAPTLTLNDGGHATYSGGSGTNTLTFTYTVAAGENTSDLAVTGSSLNGATVLDGAGNAANLAGAAVNPTGTLQIDTHAPTVTSVTTSGTGIDGGGNGDLNAGHVVTFTVNLDEAVTVDTTGGNPTLVLNDGGVAHYSGGSGSNVLTFTYTVGAGENTADLAVNSVALNGATAHDAAGNAADLSGAATNPAGTLQIDTAAAHVASVTTSGAGIDGSGNGILTIGGTVTFTVNMDETVFVTGGPATLVLNNGGIATYSGGSGSSALTFTYTVAAGENTSDLAVNSVNLNGATVATIQDAATNDANLSGAVTNPAGTLQINTTAPTVSSVTTSGTDITAGDGDLNVGHTVTFTVTLDENVTVAGGVPTLTLNNGGVATYSGGSGSSALTFTYTVAAGQDVADLAVTAANLNGATIKDVATNNADLAAAVTNPAGTLQIDTIAPTVSSVATSGTGITAGDGLLHTGDTVTFTVHLSEAVTVAGGAPTLILNDGGHATYSGGTGTDTLTFTYTVAAGESIGDLAVTGSSLNGATVLDGAGNAANLVGAAVNPTGTLQVDGIAPTVSSVTTSGPSVDGSGNGSLHIGDTVTFTVTLDEAVTIAGGVPTLTLNDGGHATYSGGTGTNTLTFTYTVAAGQSTADLAVTATALNGATVRDQAGNDADLSAAATNPAGTLQVDGTVPTVASVATSGTGITAGSGNLNAGDIVVFTVNMSENVTITGTPSLTLNDGGVATYVNGSGTNTLTFVYTVAAGENTGDLAVTAANLNGGTIKDAAGNAADLGAAVINPSGTLQIDTTTPTVSSVATSGAGITAGTGNLNAGDVVTFTVNASEAVFVTGSPTLTLNDGGVATYTGGSGSSALTFSYTVLAGQNTSDLTVTAANLNGGTIQDGAGNAANLSAAVTNPAGTLKIDTTAPTVSVAANDTSLVAGQAATVTFTFSEAVTDFTLGDVLATGGSLSNLVHVGVNGSNQDIYTATFTPVATNTENGQVQVNVSSYTDLAGNSGAASNAVNFTGDTLKPHGTAVANPGSGVLMYGQTAHITLSFTEAVTFSGGVPVLTLNDGGHATFNAAATLLLGDPTKLVFDYTVGAGDSSVSTLAITGVSNGSITDLAGNTSDSLATSFNGLSVQTSVISAHNDINTVKTSATVSADAAHGVLVNDTDTNPADHLVVSAVNGSAGGVDHTVNGSYGSLTLHADGSYSYTANGSIPGYAVVDTFSYTASNGHGQTSTSTLSVGVVNGTFNYISVPTGGSATTPTGNTVLDGSAGNVTLTSSTTLNGQHVLIGGPGDILNGGRAPDTFVFAGDFGHNTVNNYQVGYDYIQLQQSQVGSMANVLADLHQVGANAVLTIDADHVITITNTQVASLSAANFHLV